MSDGGYCFVMGPCVACGNPFMFNPHKVPSLDLKDGRGRQPLCLYCHKLRQERRAELDLPLDPDPLPGAYEPLPVEEL